MNLNELLRQIFINDKAKRLSMAKAYTKEVLSYFIQYAGEEQGTILFIYLLSIYSYLPSHLTDEKRIYISKLMDKEYTGEEFSLLMNGGNDINRINSLIKLLRLMDISIRYKAVTIGICICEKDNHLTYKEEQIFNCLLNGITIE